MWRLIVAPGWQRQTLHEQAGQDHKASMRAELLQWHGLSKGSPKADLRFDKRILGKHRKPEAHAMIVSVSTADGDKITGQALIGRSRHVTIFSSDLMILKSRCERKSMNNPTRCIILRVDTLVEACTVSALRDDADARLNLAVKENPLVVRPSGGYGWGVNRRAPPAADIKVVYEEWLHRTTAVHRPEEQSLCMCGGANLLPGLHPSNWALLTWYLALRRGVSAED